MWQPIKCSTVLDRWHVLTRCWGTTLAGEKNFPFSSLNRELLGLGLGRQGAAGPGAWGTGSYQAWHLGTEERYGVFTHGLRTRCLYVFHKASCYSLDLNWYVCLPPGLKLLIYNGRKMFALIFRSMWESELSLSSTLRWRRYPVPPSCLLLYCLGALHLVDGVSVQLCHGQYTACWRQFPCLQPYYVDMCNERPWIAHTGSRLGEQDLNMSPC